jgi:hypothetical protein
VVESQKRRSRKFIRFCNCFNDLARLAVQVLEGMFAHFTHLTAVGRRQLCDLAQRARRLSDSSSGFIQVPGDGVYEFSTESDDGGRLYIHDELVVDNDGCMP